MQVVAHRGASDEVAEHTLAAYRRAIEHGVDALEADIRLTADGHLVCVHDRRVDRTSNGRGVLSTLELADLADLDFGSWKQGSDDEDVPDRTEPPGENADDRLHRVLTLERLLGLIVDSPRRVELAVETKHPTRYAGLVERKLVELLERFDLHRHRPDTPSPVRVMSFSELSLRRMRKLAPDLQRVYLMDRVPLMLRDGSLPYGVFSAGPSIDILRLHPRYVQRLHDQGNAVHAWTVDEDSDIDLCVKADVEAIITNRPRTVLSRLGRTPS